MLPAVKRFLLEWWFYIDWGTFAAALLSIPSVLVRRRGRPVAAVSWILALMSIPAVGILLWWLFGRRHLERRRRRKTQAHDTITRKLASLRDELEAPPSQVASLNPLKHVPAEMAEGVFPPTSGNKVELISSKEAFAMMEKDIRDAEHHIHAQFYIWKDDDTGKSFRNALIEMAKKGREVRVLCDAIGSPVMATRFSRPLRKSGAQCVRFLPPQWFSRTPRLNFRNHRKILVIDGKIGYIGGFNIGNEYRDEWRDLGARIVGPAVDQLQEIFADDWFYAAAEDLVDAEHFGQWQTQRDHGTACAAIASGPDSKYRVMHDALFMAINETQKRLYIVTPYFIPTRAIGAALRAAVFRGVDVRIMLPALSDVAVVRHAARSYYPELIDVGVGIYEYQPSMLHAKVLMFDDELVMIGSANLDSRSFKLNFEASCFIGGKAFTASAVAAFEDDLKHCKRITQADLDELPWTSKLASATAHLLSPLL